MSEDISFGISFSKHFGLKDAWFTKNKVFNPTLDVDSLLFVDPFLLRSSSHREFKQCAFDAYIAHFKKICSLLLHSNEEGDKAWKGALQLFRQSETKGLSGTCLGYSKHSTKGHAFGPELARRSLIWADAVVKLGIKDPELFSSLPLFEAKIGPDLISDMVTGITLDCILAFNKRILAKIARDHDVSIPLEEVLVRNRSAKLPLNPYSPTTPILLVPSDILRHLPILDDARSLREMAEASDFRQRVNEHIGEIFKIRTKEEKDAVKKRAMESKEAFQALLDLLKLIEQQPYDVRSDPFGLVEWRSVGRQLAQSSPLKIDDDKKRPRLERLKHVAEVVIAQFKKLVETNRMSRLFHVNGKPRHEQFAQLVFLIVAKMYCDANDLDIAPESDLGAGPVDFKFSDGGDNVVVEVKLSTNGHVVQGFEHQLTAYENAENSKFGHYVLINVGSLGTKWERVSAIQKSNKGFAKLRKIHLIDGTLKESASKLMK